MAYGVVVALYVEIKQHAVIICVSSHIWCCHKAHVHELYAFYQ